MKKLLFIFALCLIPLLTRAEQIKPSLIKDDVCGFYAVLHINGVMTDIFGARDNLNAIGVAYGNAHSGHKVRYGLAYNQTRGLILDVHQAYQQILFSFPGITYGDWLGHVLNAILPEWITDSVIGSISARLKPLLDWRRPDTFFDSDLSSMVWTTGDLGFLTPQTRLTIVGHSHGTIYANIMYRYLTSRALMERQQVGLMSIAAFVPLIEGSGLYVTNRNDNPVNAGRVLYSDVKAGTITIPHTEPYTNDWRGHGLITKYLADYNSTTQIKANMKTVMNRLGSGSRQPATVWQVAYPPTTYNTVNFDPYCSPTYPCSVWDAYGSGAYSHYSTPFMFYGFPGVGGDATQCCVWKAATLAEAKAVALSNAQLCYRLARDEAIRRRTASTSYWFNEWFTIPGCASSIGHPYTGVWFAYSGDGTPVFTTDPYYYGYPLATRVGATCKRA